MLVWDRDVYSHKTIFNVFLEYIIMDAFSGFEGMVSIERRPITNLHVADDIVLCDESHF